MLTAKTAAAQTRPLLTAHSIGLHHKSVKVKPIYIVEALLAEVTIDVVVKMELSSNVGHQVTLSRNCIYLPLFS